MDQYISNMRTARKATPSVRTSTWAKANADVITMMRERQFSNAKGVHLVALYANLHRQIYGSEPLELTPQERLKAASAATRMLQKTFDGDIRVMVEFMVWCWRREAKTEEGRRNRAEMNGWRLVWQTQFAVWTNGVRLVSDFIAAAQRSQSHPSNRAAAH